MFTFRWRMVSRKMKHAAALLGLSHCLLLSSCATSEKTKAAPPEDALVQRLSEMESYTIRSRSDELEANALLKQRQEMEQSLILPDPDLNQPSDIITPISN